jgi:hypothetical protein
MYVSHDKFDSINRCTVIIIIFNLNDWADTIGLVVTDVPSAHSVTPQRELQRLATHSARSNFCVEKYLSSGLSCSFSTADH